MPPSLMSQRLTGIYWVTDLLTGVWSRFIIYIFLRESDCIERFRLGGLGADPENVAILVENYLIIKMPGKDHIQNL